VIHGDLKPANVKIARDETVKLLDFDLAKIAEPEVPGAGLSASPTLSVQATDAGRSLSDTDGASC